MEEFSTALPDGDWMVFERKLDAATSRRARKHLILMFWGIFPAGVAAIIAILIMITRESYDDTFMTNQNNGSITAQSIKAQQDDFSLPTLESIITRSVDSEPQTFEDKGFITDPETTPEPTVTDESSNDKQANESLIISEKTVKDNEFTPFEDVSTGKSKNVMALICPASGILTNGIALGIVSHESTASKPATTTPPGIMHPHIDYTKHYMPLIFGISFRYSLSDKWSIVSGLDYSLYVSDISTGQTAFKKSQCTNYIGVPIRADYHFCDFGDIGLYAGLGVKADWCFNSNINGTIQNNTRNPAITTFLSFALQYNISPVFSLYLEPSASMLMTAASPNGISTYRDSNRIYYSTSIGFRININ
ncbi:MAG: hypothetical protein IJU68_02450 [Bacteroidales bacterium]|nr:hypothetical protein [Bacteroidales bacterium]